MEKGNVFFSVIIPVKNLSYYLLFENLPAFQEESYKSFEVIVLPNEQGLYDLTLLRKYSWLRIIPTGKITKPAEKRDFGAQNAKGTVLAFIDDDAYPHKDWLKKAYGIIKKNKAVSVCGPGILPHRVEMWETVFDEILKSPLGSGTYSFRFTPKKQREVDDFPSMNFFVEKDIFLKLGGFNSDYWPGEDSKLCNDLVYKEKKRIIYDPGIVVYHHRRKDLNNFLRQHGNYGFHRGAFFAHGDKNSKKIAYLLPLLLVVYLIVFPFLYIFLTIVKIPILQTILVIPLSLYTTGLIYLLVWAFYSTKNLFIPFASVGVLFLMHLSYGIMFFQGYFKGKTTQNIYN